MNRYEAPSGDNFLRAMGLIGNIIEIADRSPVDERACVEIINTAREPLVLVTGQVVKALDEGGGKSGRFLNTVAAQITDSRARMGRLQEVMRYLGQTQEGESPEEMREKAFRLHDLDVTPDAPMRRRIMELKRESDAGDARAENELAEFLDLCDAEFDEENPNWLRSVGVRYPSKDMGLHVPGVTPPVYMIESDPNKRRQTFADNNRVMEKVGYALGILEEGEMWHDFVQRNEFKGVFDEIEERRNAAPFGRHLDITPGTLSVDSRFKGVRVGVSLSADVRQIVNFPDMNLPGALMVGVATASLELVVPRIWCFPQG